MLASATSLKKILPQLIQMQELIGNLLLLD